VVNVEVGQLWKVTTETFYTSGEHNQYKRPVKIGKGEIIEIRYPCAWHFRTKDDNYFHCTLETLMKNAVLYGKIREKVRFGNNCKTEEILRLYLYDKLGK
jgi:hypothetical protein